MTTVAYPRLIRRVRAVLLDSVLLPIAAISTLLLGDAAGVSSAYGKVLLIVLPIFLLEPGLVWLTGGTAGHHALGIRVTKRDGSGHINLFAATVRFAVKFVLGWLSFIFVLTTTKHQAVHDLIAGSIVIHKDPAGLPAHEVLQERPSLDDGHIYPPAWHRALVIAAYWLVVTVGFVLAVTPASTGECMSGRRCTTFDYLANIVLEIAWLIGLGWVTVRGWTGRLPGCRRRPRDAA